MIKDIKVIYENNDVLVLNKPAGLLTHRSNLGVQFSSGNQTSAALTDWLIQKYPEIKKVGDEPELRPGIVHRLDKDTSGILIVAKNQKAFDYLKQQWQEHKVQKTYLALVYGNVKKDKGVIDLALGKSKKDFRKRAVEGASRGETSAAITEYQVKKRFSNYTLLEIYPKTGRTHQIRIHLKAIHHPIVCDKLYAPKNSVCPRGLKRQFLHAFALELVLPNGAMARFEAELPDDLFGVAF